MRESKFRAWDKVEKRFWYFTLQEILERRMVYRGSWDEKVLNGEKTQYTGLKDKNGVEIYEGDVLSTDLDRPYLIVVYRNGAFMFDCSDGGKEYYDLMVPINEESDALKYHEVIGNIHENPELLDEVK